MKIGVDEIGLGTTSLPLPRVAERHQARVRKFFAVPIQFAERNVPSPRKIVKHFFAPARRHARVGPICHEFATCRGGGVPGGGCRHGGSIVPLSVRRVVVRGGRRYYLVVSSIPGALVWPYCHAGGDPARVLVCAVGRGAGSRAAAKVIGPWRDPWKLWSRRAPHSTAAAKPYRQRPGRVVGCGASYREVRLREATGYLARSRRRRS